MSRIDLALYGVHVAFWGSFALASVIARRPPSGTQPAAATGEAPARTKQPAEAQRSRLLIIVHIVAFAVLYFGIAQAVLPERVPRWFPGQRIVATVVVALGAVVMAWARLHFRSWRFRAKLDAGHELATGGPFALVRHPIYLGLNLLTLGTAVWVPTVIVWLATALVLVGSDLRARAEEELLLAAFGNAYRDYSKRTRRFVPGVY